MRIRSAVAAITFVVFAPQVASVQAEVVIETVTVGNPGNAGEQTRLPDDTYYGGVDYVYVIGKYEVTAGQYTEFLNAVAATDTYRVYYGSMWVDDRACKIQRSGSSGNYSYSVAPDWANRPVNWVSWAKAARFANWLHNGQPTGAQGLATTEDGSYFLDGALGPVAVVREEDATWVIPSEDEWYKAAYHKNDGVTGNYYDYPTSSDSVPSNELIDPDPGNNATSYGSGFTIGSPYFRTEVGAHENSESPYGTFDQGGNVSEWNDTIFGRSRGLRGGAFAVGSGSMHAAHYGAHGVSSVSYSFGFRVGEVPERGRNIPTLPEWGFVAMALLVLTAGTLLWGRRGAAA